MDTASLERHGPLGRFAAPVEAEYQEWFVHHILPLATAMALASLAAWVVAPVTVLFTDDGLVSRGWVFAVCWGIHTPMLTFGTIWVRRSGGRHLISLGTLAIAVTA